jgi:predicted amidohydrolase
MKLCVAQTRPFKGDVQANIERHIELLELAAANGADTVIFPELSLTGYEPTLAKELATQPEDRRFDPFQTISDARGITIGVGVPTKNPGGICISMVLFQPHQPRQIYSKAYLHSDEDPFFVPGKNSAALKNGRTNIALAICYELSVPEHAEKAFKNGAQVYLASVAKTASGVEKALHSLSEIARKYSMTVLMSNCLGLCDGVECAGKSSVWNNEGRLLGQLNDAREGIVLIDTDTGHVLKQTL